MPTPDDALIGVLLSFAYPDRIAQRRAAGGARGGTGYRLASGRGVRLPEDDPLGGEEFLVAAQLDAGQGEGRVYLAAALTRADLLETQGAHLTESTHIAWEPRAEAVVAEHRRRLGRLVLERAPLADPPPEAAIRAMLDGIQRLGLAALPWTREARAFQARVQSLGHWLAEPGDDGDWPDLSDAALAADLRHWLAPYLDGITRRDHLTRLDLEAILRARLDWPQRQRLDRDAPETLQVPSGSRIHLRYEPGQPPVLAVRLQEMFGLADTPRVDNGRVPVLLHLLSPAQRPIQVTTDLKGFWERTYHEVRKELKGRYPKHHWPDDPWNAPPTRSPRRRKPQAGNAP